MYPLIKKMTFIVIIGFLITSCGKVVQQVSDENDNIPTFALSFSVKASIPEDVSNSTEEKEPTPSNLLQIMGDNKSKDFLVSDKLYSVLKGYQNDTVKNIAYSTIETQKEIIIETIISPNIPANLNLNEMPAESEQIDIEKTVYTATSYDIEKIEITKAKRTQFEVDFNEEESLYYLKTVNIEKVYDYYLMAIYKNAEEYKMKIIDNKIVSQNISITVDTLTAYDTFKSLIFVEAHRTVELTPDFYNAINEVFNKDMFNSLLYVFPKMSSREIKKKKPIFKFKDPLIERIIEILELMIIDKEEIIYELENKESVLFTKDQIEKLIDNINKFELISEEL